MTVRRRIRRRRINDAARGPVFSLASMLAAAIGVSLREAADMRARRRALRSGVTRSATSTGALPHPAARSADIVSAVLSAQRQSMSAQLRLQKKPAEGGLLFTIQDLTPKHIQRAHKKKPADGGHVSSVKS